jgi:hypothetical protein
MFARPAENFESWGGYELLRHRIKGIEYVREKIAVVKLPVKRKPPPIPKSQAPPQEPPPEISDEEWAKQREKARITFNEFKESMRGGPLDGGFSENVTSGS